MPEAAAAIARERASAERTCWPCATAALVAWMALTLAAVVAVWGYVSYERKKQSVQAELVGRLQAARGTLNLMLATAESGARAVARELPAAGADREALARALAARAAATPFPTLYAVIDGGLPVASSEPLAPDTPLARLAPPAAVGKTPPETTGTAAAAAATAPPVAIGNRWMLPLAIEAGDGRRVAAAIDVEAILAHWRGLDLPPGSAIAMTGPDVRMWARLPFDVSLVGRDMSGTPMGRALNGAGERGLVRVKSTVTDGRDRYLAWLAPDARFGFRLHAGLPVDYVFARWREHYGASILLSSVAGVLMIAVVWASLRRMGRSEQQRRSAVDALAEGERRLRTALEGSRDGLWDWDLRRDTVHYSGQFQQMVGSPGEDFAQRFRFADRLHPDDQARVTAAVRRAIDERQFFDEEYRLRRADGSYGWYRGRGRAHYADDGTPVSFSGFLTDLTRQKAAEAALRASETRYRGLFESSPQPMWVHDLESMRFLAVNEAAVRAYGYGRDEFASMTVLQLLCDDGGPGLLEALEVLPVDEPLQQATPWRHRRKDGTEMLVELTSHRIAFGGHPAELVLAVDVTAAVEARRALHERERMLAALSDRLQLATRIAGLGVFEWDLHTRRGLWNERLLAIFGLARDPDGGGDPPGTRALLDGFADDDRPRLQRMLRDAVAGLPSPGQGEEFRVTRPDGEAREVLVCAQVQLDDAGEPASVVFAIQDITERKRYEDARRAREAAELASRAKSEFLSRVSHELRTPLNAMLGFAQLLEHDRDPPLAPPQLEQVRHIQRAGWHLLDMIDDVLDLSRIEAGRLRLAIEPLQAAAAVRDALPMVETLAQERGVRIVDRVPPHASRALLADPTRLRQVLVNLLSNAVKYSRAGGTVAISCGRHRDRIAIAVSDQGIGMGPEQMRRLFEPFDRLGAERHRIEGTGIGLVITRALLEMMGGSIEVWSEPGAGTVFAAWLPAVPSAPADGVPDPGGASPARVLYIEDNAANAALVATVLRQRPGIALALAPDGESGVAQARTERPDLALIDVDLPDIDGFEVLRRLRADPATAGIRCIALSADATARQAARARAAGFEDYWTKPIRAERFREALDAALRRGAHAPVATPRPAAAPDPVTSEA